MGKYLVYGTGKSGICAGALLLRQNEEIVFFDENEKFNKGDFILNNPEFADCSFKEKSLDKETIDSVDTVVLSPGVPLDHENVKKLKDAGKEIIGELELGFRYEKGKVVAITGTNGKTTTTSLVGHIIRRSGKETFVAGNIGDPYTAVCDKTNKNSITVLEVSSFQLETIKNFAPDACAILNITPDHLDRHKTFENYAEVKMSMAKALKPKGTCVLNYNDNVLRDFGESLRKTIAYFSSSEEISPGFFLKDKSIYIASTRGEAKIIDTKDLEILGVHNYENSMAAIALCLSMGISMEDIVVGLKSFKAVEHRIEFVCEKNGIRYYNDSKGTNTDAAIRAVLSMESPIILIGGGYDKKADYTDWVKTFDGRVKHIVLIGESAKDIANCCDRNGFNDYSFEDTFDSAVESAIARASKGDCVLLSPACASWDMFKNFEERGRIFKELVRK